MDRFSHSGEGVICVIKMLDCWICSSGFLIFGKVIVISSDVFLEEAVCTGICTKLSDGWAFKE